MSQFEHDVIVPDTRSNLTKKKQVAQMFDSIAVKYDFLNRFLSGGIDIWWRKKAITQLISLHPKIILDVATGTADVALMTYKLLQPKKIIGIDISVGMLDLGRKKIQDQGLSNVIELQTGDSEQIHFANNYFDAITVAFGVRNFENLNLGLQEMLRVLKPGGKLVVLEFSKPKKSFFKGLYQFYLSKMAPSVVQIFSSDKKAYQYLNNSVQAFPEGQTFLNIMHEAGFTQTYLQTLSLGICTIYCGTKN
jgi:demethylmenaquinone methyltransferase/2-methoxy-6-polyprenyl-1,4-benzoquinol methylase